MTSPLDPITRITTTVTDTTPPSAARPHHAPTTSRELTTSSRSICRMASSPRRTIVSTCSNTSPNLKSTGIPDSFSVAIE